MRNYTSEETTVGTIANEVIATGSSKNWVASNSEEIRIAGDLEKYLAKFNIGYIDDANGSWGMRKNGSRHFASMAMIKSAKSGLGKVVGYFRK